MDVNQMQQMAIDALNDLKGLDIVVLDVKELTTLADCMLICTGRSNRHVKSLADNVIMRAKQNHLSYIKTEGQQEGEWVIVDLADVIVHIMLPATREFYKLEDLWEPIRESRELNGNSAASGR